MKGFSVSVVFVKLMEDYKELFNGVGKLYVSLSYTSRVLVMSCQLPWQCARSTKTSSNFQFLEIIWKTNSVTCRFYFFFGKFPKFFFSDSMEKGYLVELNILKDNAFYGLQKILLANFSRNIYIWSSIVKKTQDRSPNKISS